MKKKTILLVSIVLIISAAAIGMLSSGYFFKKPVRIKKIEKKVIDKSYYQLTIESPKEFKATISTYAITGNIDDTLNLIRFDSLQKQLRSWKINIITENKISIDTIINVTSNESLINGLNQVFTAVPYLAPINASFKFQNNAFTPVEAINGNQINIELLSSQIMYAIKTRRKDLILNYDVHYLKPKFKLGSAETNQALKDLNKCLSSRINYTLRNEQIVLTKSDFGSWLKVDSNMHVIISDAKAVEYIRLLADKNDIVVKNITFKTSGGVTKTVNGGDLGYRINIYKECSDLCKDIKNGNTVTREPNYGMRGIPNGAFDSNKTYVEINISAQKLWYYKSGNLIIESDIVTGNTSNGNSTPSGAYYIKYKELNATLNGPGYSTKVQYWMPFNEGVGLHDASWRSIFGGTIYKSNGSHGCINLPFLTAQTIYNNIGVGAIVICYTD